MSGWVTQLFASTQKELKLLLRDRAGMVLLFLMPLFFVVVMTLIQDKVTTATVQVLFVDEDQGLVGAEIRRSLAGNDTVQLVEPNEALLAGDHGRQLVGDGTFQFALIIPRSASDSLAAKVKASVRNQLLQEKDNGVTTDVPSVRLWFDPTVHGSFRAAVSVAVQQAVRSVEAQLIIDESLQVLPEKFGLSGAGGVMPSTALAGINTRELMPQLFAEKTMLPVNERFASTMGFVKQPTAVQQNVPAWAIFGIFFLVVPLAGSLIGERDNGTLARLRTMPVSYLTIMLGKISCYMLVGILQFFIITGVGIMLFPYLGLNAFAPGDHWLGLAVMVLVIIWAACGYGILLGTFGKTQAQVAVFAPISIVIAAAVGGIMVPVYALPDTIRPVCMLSPLYWAQNGFYDLILRNVAGLAIGPEIVALGVFGTVCIVLSSLFFGRKRAR